MNKTKNNRAMFIINYKIVYTEKTNNEMNK
jgi:hypothetical protein